MIPLAARQLRGWAGGGELAGWGCRQWWWRWRWQGPGLADAAGWQPGAAGLSRARRWGCITLKVTDVKRQDESQGSGRASVRDASVPSSSAKGTQTSVSEAPEAVP